MGSFLSSSLSAGMSIERTLRPPAGGIESGPVRRIRNNSKAFRLSWYQLPNFFWGFLAIPVVIGLLVGVGAWQFGWLGAFAAFILVTILGTVLPLNVNRWSLHSFYRGRLANVYLEGEPKLSELACENGAPYHLICAAVNLPKSEDEELRGRRSDFLYSVRSSLAVFSQASAQRRTWRPRTLGLISRRQWQFLVLRCRLTWELGGVGS